MSEKVKQPEEGSQAEVLTLSIVITLTLIGLGYLIFQLFIYLGARTFFNEWIDTLFRVILGNLAALGMKNSGNRASFWMILVWMVVTLIPFVNILPIYLSGRYLAQKRLGLR